jgi:hypothetical protein
LTGTALAASGKALAMSGNYLLTPKKRFLPAKTPQLESVDSQRIQSSAASKWAAARKEVAVFS